jgi:thiol:disulfide interchange protein DsbA
MPTEHLFVAGRDYQILPTSNTAPKTILAQTNQQPVRVIEFFSYGCPACNHLEPDLEAWLKNRTPKLVQFERVPVVFHSEWVNYAKAYYTAKMLGIEPKVTPAIFAAVHEQQQDLSSTDALVKLFAKQGVDEQTFKSIFNFTPAMAVKLSRSNQLMEQYKIVQIPALVINGKYITNPALTNGDNQKLLSVVDHLINQELISAPRVK